MRTLVDTNVLFSKLMAKGKPYSTVDQVIISAIQGNHALLVPEEVIDELRRARASKPFLPERITQDELTEFIELLRGIAEIIPRQLDPIPAVLRDPKDDFLLTAAALGDADYLVTGDRDLLDIRDHLTRPRILTVAEFLQILAA